MKLVSTFEAAIQIAGVTTRLRFSDLPEEKRNRLIDHYSPFFVSQASDEVFIQVSIEDGDPYLQSRGTSFQMETRNNGGLVEFVSYYEKASVDLNTKLGSLRMRQYGDPENFLRVLYAWRLLETQALLVHACGLIRDDKGYVFFGPSGSGKTTVTRLSAENIILSDDLVVIKPEQDHGLDQNVYVYGVPFRGEMAEAPRTNDFAPLIGLSKLKKSPQHRLSKLPFSSGVAELAASIPFVLTDPKNSKHVLEICQAISQKIPISELEFRKDAGFWRLFDDASHIPSSDKV